METRNSKQLKSFVEYCENNPEQRFWQALRNWSGYSFVYLSNDGDPADLPRDDFKPAPELTNPFYWEY